MIEGRKGKRLHRMRDGFDGMKGVWVIGWVVHIRGSK
jgi:phage gp29-like protein